MLLFIIYIRCNQLSGIMKLIMLNYYILLKILRPGVIILIKLFILFLFLLITIILKSL